MQNKQATIPLSMLSCRQIYFINSLTTITNNMLHRLVILFLIIFAFTKSMLAIPYEFKETIKWNEIQTVKVDEGFSFDRLTFDGAIYQDLNIIPHFVNLYPIHTDKASLSIKLINIVYEVVSITEQNLLISIPDLDTSFHVSANMVLSRKEPFVQVDIIPIRWNEAKKIYEKLTSFIIELNVEDIFEQDYEKAARVSNSVLASGDWYKIKIDKSGIFKITYQDLSSMGFDLSGDPRKIALYGNGGGVLPEKNDLFRYDDLVENPIVVVGESDGKLDAGDYIIFYGEGPFVWNYNNSSAYFEHQNNYYDDYSYYFITLKSQSGKRIQKIDNPTGNPDINVTTFNDYQFHEIDERNLAGTGRIWYGELFDFNSTYDFSFDFPNIIKTNESGFIDLDFASISESSNNFEIYLNGVKEKTLSMPTISATNSYQIADDRGTDFKFTPKDDEIAVRLIYNRVSNQASGYLNYISLNVERNLRMAGNQMAFVKSGLSAQGEIAKYTLSNANDNITIWDITEPVNAKLVDATLASNNLQFSSTTEQQHKYIAFDGALYHSTAFVEKIANQNLHSVRNVDYILIADPAFLDEANRLAEFHQQHSNLSTYVTTPARIYNEFSSGSQDVSGIRDFVKMIYDESNPGNEPKYLLLFGDASYDYKDILSADNSNFVPCWEDIESLNIVHSVATDDFFGYLDDGEGEINSNTDRVDIGIGRFVVASVDEAQMAVNKTIHYATNTDEVMGPWRNILTFVTDDGDNNTHLKHGEILSGYLQENHNVYNIDKIYVDAYTQVSTPSGQRAPEVNQAINNRMAKGTLIMNYNGHGGEIGWGHERFLQITDINSWTNYDMMPIFITATCEFSRYDDLSRVSAGELVFLNEKGGGVALFSTARATFASANLALNSAIYRDNLFTKVNGKYPCFGDVIRKSKTQGGDNDRKFVLLGDPALQLAYPELNVETIKINGELCVEEVADTLKALSKISIEGQITDADGNLVSNFNGLIFPTIYDKKSEIVTLGDQDQPYTFYLRQNILFNGKASVVDGQFYVEFIVPRDIAYNFGGGRISYYLNNDSIDGQGYYENIIVGGYDKNAAEDNEGPDINLFMNDTTFVDGGTTDENPLLLARVFDESGINTTGSGIGHDILATIEGLENSDSYILNQYYEADVDSYNSGIINYPFHKLDNGDYTLSLRVWDIHNNSSVAYLDFIVVSSSSMIVENLMNYPNPFMSNTNFVFDHNQTGQELNVLIYIFNTNGGLVKTIETEMTPEGYRSTPISWDGSTDAGGKIGRGLYLYKLVVRNENGTTQEENSKLIYIRN